MYKVFIDNVPTNHEVGSENDLIRKFSDYEYIEAAGGIVKNKDKFLFIKRHGFWDIPKGKLDEGESPEQAAVREIEEECGLEQPKLIDHLTDTWHTYEQNGKKYLKKTYWYILESTADQENIKPQTEEGITEVTYFKWDELYQVKKSTYNSIVEVIATLQHHLNA